MVDQNRVTLDLDLTDLELGEHLVQLHAIDSDGMEALTGVPFVVDGAISAPTVTIESPAKDEVTQSETIKVAGTVTDRTAVTDHLQTLKTQANLNERARNLLTAWSRGWSPDQIIQPSPSAG